MRVDGENGHGCRLVQLIQPLLDDCTGRFDILLTRHEYQNVALACRVSEMNLENLLDGAVNVILTRRFAVERLDRECSAGNCELRCVAEEIRKLVRIHSGRRDNEFEVATAGKN